MGAVAVQQMADRVARLMEDRLRIRGRDLAEKLRRGGRLLPRAVRDEAAYLAEAVTMAQHPKIGRMLDEERIAHAYDACLRHLNGIGARERRIAALVGIAASVAFSLLVVALAFVGVLVWRGFL
jgi:hypothetical protein